MALKLYGRYSSPFVNIVAFTLNEKDANYELVFCKVDKFKTPEFLATMNPFGQMPVFRDGDLTLSESRAIARYVIAKFEGQGTASLLGSTLQEQAMVNMWTDVESHIFFPVFWPICFEFFSKKVPNEAMVAENMEKLHKILDVYEQRLAKSKYLAGDFLSLADIVHVPSIHFFLCIAEETLKSVVTDRPHVHAWYKTLTKRPAWQRILADTEASDWSSFPKK